MMNEQMQKPRCLFLTCGLWATGRACQQYKGQVSYEQNTGLTNRASHTALDTTLRSERVQSEAKRGAALSGQEHKTSAVGMWRQDGDV